MSKRVLIVVAFALAVAVPAYLLARPETGVPEGAPTEDAMATSLGAPIMEHLVRGHVAGRSGELMLVPKPHNFLLGEWDLTTLGTDTPTLSTSHPNPWNYLTRVPIVLYGPGYLEEQGVAEEREVDIADLAPTFAEMLGMDGLEFDGEPLISAPAGRRPKVIFTVVIDGGGWNVLQEHVDSWPNIERVMDSGLTYTNATIGSAPSITGALHATFGTGVYPDKHGIPGNQMRGPDGENTDTWLQNADPRYLQVPTVAELWDEQNGNEPTVATVSYEGWHLGMIGAGAGREGGDKDVAVLWEAETDEWWINEDFYELPPYLQSTDLATLEGYEEALDERDGLADGTWFGHTLEQLQEPLVRPGTPAFVRFTGDAVVDVMQNEGVGDDAITDIVWIEMKMPDYAGHAWNVEGPEQADVLRETDRQIGRFLEELDETVGRGEYVFALSADHGQQPLPDLHGGWRINNRELQRDIEARFGNIVEKVTPVDVYFDRERIEDEDVSIDDVARFVGTYTIGENIPDGAEGAERVPDDRLEEILFAGAFSTDYLTSLTADEVAAFGEGDYPEGDFTIGDD
ncbi:MAG: alkaline phosphatase family protein [Actinomycetota bacterium]